MNKTTKQRLVLSANGYTLLKHIARKGQIDIQDLGQYDQRPLRTMIRWSWVRHAGSHVIVTDTGLAALREFSEGKIFREHAHSILSQYVEDFLKLRQMRKAG